MKRESKEPLTETNVSHDPAQPSNDAHNDPVGHLLRLAGARPPVPPERAARVRAAARTEWGGLIRGRRRRRLFAVGSLLLATAATLVVALGWVPRRERVTRTPVVATLLRTQGPVWLTRPTSGDPTGSASLSPAGAVAAGSWIETGANGRAALELSGGTSLRLDVSTYLQVASPSRLVLRRGAVYVDSGIARLHEPVTIETALGTARDVGTQFELRLVGDSLRLRVREGRVKLDCSAGSEAAREGEELRLTPDLRLERGSVELQGAPWEWTQTIAPAFALEGHSLAAFLDWYARETRYAVDTSRVAAVTSLNGVLLHGTVDDLTPQEALEAVLPTCGLSHRLIGTRLLVEPQHEANGRAVRRE